jgi:hypothetical protein
VGEGLVVIFSLSLWERAGSEGIPLFSLSLWERAGVRASDCTQAKAKAKSGEPSPLFYCILPIATLFFFRCAAIINRWADAKPA